jgi:hypothetical protein
MDGLQLECLCGRTCPTQAALTWHERNCGKRKKCLSGVLARAKEVWETRKRRRVDVPGQASQAGAQSDVQRPAGNTVEVDSTVCIHRVHSRRMQANPNFEQSPNVNAHRDPQVSASSNEVCDTVALTAYLCSFHIHDLLATSELLPFQLSTHTRRTTPQAQSPDASEVPQ